MARPRFIFILLLVICFSLAAWLQPRRDARLSRGAATDSALATLLRDERQMAADYFYMQADVYFHSGYYPSVFDQARQEEVNDSDVSHPEETNGAPEAGFLGPPMDWIDRFSRHFRPTRHTHLHGQLVAEILPWMRLSADLDPHKIQTYITASYFLRNYLGNKADAKSCSGDDPMELIFHSLKVGSFHNSRLAAMCVSRHRSAYAGKVPKSKFHVPEKVQVPSFNRELHEPRETDSFVQVTAIRLRQR